MLESEFARLSEPVSRERMIERLRRLQGHSVRTCADAVALLRDGQPRQLVVDATWLIALAGKPACARPIIRQLHAAEDPELRLDCISLLADVQGLVARQELIDLVCRGGTREERFVLCQSLGRFYGQPSVVPALALCLGNALEHPTVRAQAARSLGDFPVPEAQGVLIRALTDPVWIVRVAVAEALGGMGGPEAVGALRAAARAVPATRSSGAVNRAIRDILHRSKPAQ